MSIYISDARFARGYSGYDHLLDDAPLAGLIGRTFASLASAATVADRLAHGTQDRRCAPAPVLLTDGAGSTHLIR